MTHAIGVDPFDDRNKYQRWLRQIVRHQFRFPPTLTVAALWYAAVVGLYEPTLWWVAALIAGFAVARLGISNQLMDAATLWAMWGTSGRIPKKHWQPVAAHRRASEHPENWFARGRFSMRSSHSKHPEGEQRGAPLCSYKRASGTDRRYFLLSLPATAEGVCLRHSTSTGYGYSLRAYEIA